ncbi:acetyl-CoA synthetase-like protein, partial [Aureobasidium sp. EXF-3399]
MYGGGPLPTQAGDRIASGTTLITVFGSSETGFFPVEDMQREDWPYVKLSDCAGGVYRPYANDLFELVVERKPGLEMSQPAFWMYPGLEEYHTKDLFSKHHSKPDLWLWQGRTDDIIVLSKGEKFNPIAMENMIVSGHPAVESALVCGDGREQCALLVELSSSESSEEDTSEEELVEELWLIVQKANEECPEYGRVMKNMVIVAKQGKRPIRADKSTVQRRRTLESFAAELDELYHLHEGPAASFAHTDRPMDFESVKQIVTDIVHGLPRYRTVPSSKSFFDLGLDSLHAMTMAKSIRTAFLNLPTQITTKVIYDFPSIDLLSSSICGSMIGREDSVKAMQMLYDRHSPMSRKALANEAPRAATVILVGSTGHLGTQLLDQLSRRIDVQRIYCLNRRSKVNLEQGADDPPFGNPDSTYTRYFHADYSQPCFGLSEPDLRLLQRSVLRNSRGPVSEEVVHDWLRAETMGYTQSKLVAERLIAEITATTGVKSLICRLGQLGGVLDHDAGNSKVPEWPEKEWLPAMLASSIQLGAIPSSLDSLDSIDWVPVDVAAATICELISAGSAIREACQVYNIVNPQTTSWTELLPQLAAYRGLKRVALPDWVGLLEKHIQSGPGKNIPAMSLVDFFESAYENGKKKPLVDCSKSLALSPALNGTRRIGVDLMERWISQWSFSS